MKGYSSYLLFILLTQVCQEFHLRRKILRSIFKVFSGEMLNILCEVDYCTMLYQSVQHVVQCYTRVYSMLYNVILQCTACCTMLYQSVQHVVQCYTRVYSMLYNVISECTACCTMLYQSVQHVVQCYTTVYSSDILLEYSVFQPVNSLQSCSDLLS